MRDGHIFAVFRVIAPPVLADATWWCDVNSFSCARVVLNGTFEIVRSRHRRCRSGRKNFWGGLFQLEIIGGGELIVGFDNAFPAFGNFCQRPINRAVAN